MNSRLLLLRNDILNVPILKPNCPLSCDDFSKSIYPKIINYTYYGVTFIWQTFDLKELYVIKTNILKQIIVISVIEKYCPATI